MKKVALYGIRAFTTYCAERSYIWRYATVEEVKVLESDILEDNIEKLFQMGYRVDCIRLLDSDLNQIDAYPY